MSRAVLVGVLACAVAAAGAPAGGEPPASRVSGSITVNGEKTPLVLGYVDESPDDLIVVLASKEVPRDVVPFIGEEVARRLKIHAIAFTVSRAEKALTQGFNGVFYPGPEMGFAGLPQGKAAIELTRCDATGIEGRVFAAEPFESFDHTFAFDATFSFPLGTAAPPPPPVEVKISGDDSAPSKAYAAYYRAAFSGDPEKLRPHLAAAQLEEFDAAPADDRAMMLELFAMRPAEIRIVKATVSGDTATLAVEGLNETAGKSTAEVSMVLEKGAWKLARDKWTTTSS
jgi:hypothetical protein